MYHKFREEDNVQALVLDSNQEDCAILMGHLRRAGHDTVAVASVRQAREALKSQQFDLLLLELKFPDGDGRQLCDEIRERLGEGMTIIFVSAENTPSMRVVGFQLGADDFVGKPCDEEELLARIDAHRRRRTCVRIGHQTRAPLVPPGDLCLPTATCLAVKGWPTASR